MLIEPSTLGLFLSPGPNMAFVLSHGIAYGIPFHATQLA